MVGDLDESGDLSFPSLTGFRYRFGRHVGLTVCVYIGARSGWTIALRCD